MRAFLFFLTLLAWVLAGAQPGCAQAVLSSGPSGHGPNIHASLQAEDSAPLPGTRVTLAFVMHPEPGWHGYWQNPGDAGKPLELQWDLPPGVTAGELRYPVPDTLMVAGLMNHVFKGSYAVLVDLALPRNLAPGTPLPLRVKADWLACTDTICVPEQDELSLLLTVGKQARATPENRAVFDRYRMKLPRPLGGEALFEMGAGGKTRLLIPFPQDASLGDAHFFPAATGAKSHAGHQGFVRDGDRLIVILDGVFPQDGRLEGVLRIGRDAGLVIAARPGKVPDIKGNEDGWSSVLLALAGAVAGGLILNVMPCVFPILSLKAMSLLRSASSPTHARHEAWAYGAGAMLTCLTLGGAIIALRAAGEGIGWAFQLQSPPVVMLLLGLSVAIALNLAGVYRFAPLQIDGSLSLRRGLWGDFWSGILVAFVATPCAGPFMATALGAALLLPVPAALAVFAGLGLGLALPFLLLAYVPALRTALPRPGAWMERVQRWLAVPMVLTALALLWLLWRQAGQTGLILGALVMAGMALILWGLGRAQSRHRRFAGATAAIGCAALLAGAALPIGLAGNGARTVSVTTASTFSEIALERARQGGKPVFVYFTADWCLTCKANEAGAIERAAVRKAFKNAGVRVLVGDWTNGDPDITRFLESHGRSGVPLYLWYPAGRGEPQVLPQILTPALLTGLAEQAE